MTTDGDRDEEMLLRLGDGIAPASPEEAEARAPYQRLIERLQQLESIEPRAGWKDRLQARRLAERKAARRRRYAAVAVGVVALAAAIALVIARARPARTADKPVAVIVGPDGSVRRGAANVGDVLQLSVPRARPRTELRVYAPGPLVVRCPGHGTCTVSVKRLALELPLASPGTYRPVVFTSDGAIPPPGPGGLEGDVISARSGGDAYELLEAIVVAP